jgi:hypothetical protein
VLAFVVAIVKAGGMAPAVLTIVLVLLFVAVMLFWIRPRMPRWLSYLEQAPKSSPSPPLHGGEGDLPRVARGQHAPEFALCLLNLLVNSQPGGLAEGSRWSFRAQGETTTGKPRRMAEHPGGVPDPARTCDSVARSNWFGRDESSTPCRGADICCAITRRPPPPSPAATSGCPLATLRVDPAGMSKLHGALGQRALPPNASRISIAALPRFA